MVANIEQNVEGKPKFYKISLWVFIVVLLLTIWIYFYNMSLENKIENLNSQIEQKDNDIKVAKEDGYYLVYRQTIDNKTILDKYAYSSKIPEFINNMKSLSSEKNIFFTWFNYSNRKISTKATVINDTLNLASVKAKNFIEYFRNENNNIFSLWFVSSFEWQDRINFNVDLNVE